MLACDLASIAFPLGYLSNETHLRATIDVSAEKQSVINRLREYIECPGKHHWKQLIWNDQITSEMPRNRMPKFSLLDSAKSSAMMTASGFFSKISVKKQKTTFVCVEILHQFFCIGSLQYNFNGPVKLLFIYYNLDK